MKRKVIQLAGKTLLVSLPSEWTKEFSIKKGDEVEVKDEGNKIIISTDENISKGIKEIDVSDTFPMTKRIIGSLYKKGYDEIKIKYTNPIELEDIQELVRHEFTGFEIIDQRKEFIIIKKISTVDTEEFDRILRRIFLVILSMADDSLKEFENNKIEWLNTIVLRDKDINKMADFCRRAISKRGYDTHYVYYIVEQLERIGDSYRDICKEKTKLSKNTLKYFEEVNKFFREFYEMYYKFDLKKISKFGKRRKELLKKELKEDLKIVFLLNKIIEDTFDMNGVLMAMKL